MRPSTTARGPALFGTLAANQTIEPASYEGPFTLPASALIAGTNILAAEVHQTTAGSSDIVFGGELALVLPSLILASEPPRLTIEMLGSTEARVSWTSAGTLEQSPAVTGPWTAAPVQSNPQTIPLSPTNTFFRLRW